MRELAHQLPFSTPSRAAAMPLDKQNHGTPAKPFTPTLSTNFRSTKSPLTPKLAGTSPRPRSKSPRRLVNSESPSVSQHPQRDEISTPVSSFLNSNITPRSGSRKSRIGTESPTTATSTPSGTPLSSRPVSILESTSRGSLQNHGAAGLGISSMENRWTPTSRTKSAVSDASGTVPPGRPRSSDGNRLLRDATISPKFFHADDAKSSVSTPDQDEKPAMRPKASTFFYASGATESSPKSQHLVSESSSAHPEKASLGASRPVSKPLTVAKTSSSGTPSRQSSPDISKKPQRPTSPLKQMSTKSAPTTGTFQQAGRTSLSSTTNGNKRDSVSSQPDVDLARGISNGSATSNGRRSTHRKSASIASPQSTPSKKPNLHMTPSASPKATIAVDLPQPVSASPVSSPRTTSLGSANTFISYQSSSSNQSFPAGPQSPTKATPLTDSQTDAGPSTKLQQLNELAANARRERKVLDLEISNSSLLAINRTLEREMRKQNAELRRFRRLSRAGRLSLAPSVRSASGHSTIDGLEYDNNELSSLSEESSREEDDEDEDLESSFGEDADPGTLSPSAQAEHDARHRARDEKRLLLDLSKHQQMLIDSQKMSQSIKRCMNWTEDLIAEGKKALAYQVKVSDVELGGRVLSDEEHDDIGGRKGLLSPSATIGDFEVKAMWKEGLGGVSSNILDAGVADTPEEIPGNVPQ